MEDTKTIRFSNMTKFMFNEDQAIIFNRLNGQWIKVPKQCYDIKVKGQACTNNCEEKIWAGKKEADGWEAGCWYTIGYTARGAWW